MRRFTAPLLAFALGLSPLVAGARFPEAGTPVRTSADVETLLRDSKGRIVRRTVEHFDSASQPAGRTVFESRFDGERLSQVDVWRYDAAGDLLGHGVTRYTPSRAAALPLPQVSQREEFDAAGTRVETENTEHEPDPAGVLTTATRRDAAGEVVEVRYTLTRRIVEKAARGDARTWTASDTSTYGPDGTQRSRMLVEWRDARMDRWTFDNDDQVLEHEVETRRVDAQGRLTGISSDTVDGRGATLGAREESFANKGPNGAQSERITTWFDAEGVALRRRHETFLFRNGQNTGSRVSVEVWDRLPEAAER